MMGMWRLLRWPLALLLVVLPMVALVNGWGNQYFPLRILRVQGELLRVDQAALRAAVAAPARRGFFAVDLEQVQAAVEQLPWVEHAQVRKQWPDRLIVQVDEHRPFARWGKDRLLSEHGRLFPLGGQAAPPGLPLLMGPDARATEVMALYRQAAQVLASNGGIRSVLLDKRGSWTLTLASGVQLVLGRNHMQPRLERFVPQLQGLLARHPQQRLLRADLRYTNGFALAWASADKTPRPSDHGSKT